MTAALRNPLLETIGIGDASCGGRAGSVLLSKGLRFRVRGAAIVALLVAACAGAPVERILPDSDGIEPAARLLDVPFHAQRDLHCGPAALAMVLGWAGDAVSAGDLVGAVFTEELGGSLQADLVGAARRRGKAAYVVDDFASVLVEVSEGHPVIVLQNLAFSWWPRWHYAVVIGYDIDRGVAILHTGGYRAYEIDLRVLERTWHRAGRWALLVLPPGDLPATLGEAAILHGILSLESVAGVTSVEPAYRAVLERWPESLGGWMGSGHARYAQGDFAGAERAYREATSHHPHAPEAFNNLAHVLRARGRLAAARAAIERAIAIGGTHSDTFERTLREIEAAERRRDSSKESDP